MSQGEPNPLPTGTLVQDRYRVIGAVGHGGLGRVYQVADVLFGKATIYALKEQWDQSESAKKQFEREGKWLKDLSHPSIPKVLDLFQWDDRNYLLMEYVEGENLEHKLERSGRPLPEPQVITWVLPICDALIYLHHRQPPIIHRDVKPSNIIVTSSGHTVLVDLGIAKEHGPGGQSTITFVRKAGTEGYAAPEQYSENGQTGPWSDVYGLGATLYHLLTAQIPPTAVDRVALDVRLRLPREFNPAISAATETTILRALAIRPQDRFPSLAEFKRALPAPTSLPLAGRASMSGPLGHGAAARRQPGPTWPSTPSMSSPMPAVPASPTPAPLPLPVPGPSTPPRGSGALNPLPSYPPSYSPSYSPSYPPSFPPSVPSSGLSPVPVRSSWTPPARRPDVVRSNARPKLVSASGKASGKAARRAARASSPGDSSDRLDRSRLLAHPIWWGAGLALVVLLVAVGIFATVQFFTPPDRSSATNSVNGYFASLHNQDYNRAWQYMTASQHGSSAESAFIGNEQTDDSRYGVVVSAQISALTQDSSGQQTATISVVRARSPGTPIIYTATLNQYNGLWLIDSLGSD
jgi:serine/threonine-protein kinase